MQPHTALCITAAHTSCEMLLSAAVLSSGTITMLCVCSCVSSEVSVVKVGPALRKFSFRVKRPQQTRAGRTGDATPLSHEPHSLQHTTAGFRKGLCPLAGGSSEGALISITHF